MTIYRGFARIYAKGPYPGFSLLVFDYLPPIMQQFGMPIKGKLLDVACGEGSFAIAMAKQGWEVTAIDQSPDMLELAKANAKDAGVDIDFRCQDMRQPHDVNQYDLVTCWYDSLNYLLSNDDLTHAFANVQNALRNNGFFLFDMNTIYGLAVGWQRYKSYINQNTNDVFEVHRTAYDHEKQIASVFVTGFIRRKNLWERIDETHHERGYSLDEIQNCLQTAGLEMIALYGDLKERTAPRTDNERVYFLTHRK